MQYLEGKDYFIWESSKKLPKPSQAREELGLNSQALVKTALASPHALRYNKVYPSLKNEAKVLTVVLSLNAWINVGSASLNLSMEEGLRLWSSKFLYLFQSNNWLL